MNVRKQLQARIRRNNPQSLHRAGKDGGQKEKRASEDEMAGCHQYNGHELEQTCGR